MSPFPSFLPGRLALADGTCGDYDALSAHHYLAGRPATFAMIRIVRFIPRNRPAESRPVAVGVLSYPVPSCAGRERFFSRTRFTRDQNLRFANRHIRTISRVIVHPQFRSIGLASILVHDLCARAGTKYVEAIAHMGRAHPLFE